METLSTMSEDISSRSYLLGGEIKGSSDESSESSEFEAAAKIEIDQRKTETKHDINSASEEHSDRPSSYAMIVPTDYDVLLGRGKSNKNWPGNKNFQIMINRNRELYFSGLTQYEKKTMTTEIVQSVMKKGRFLKLDKKTQTWHEVGAEAARTKVAHALQYRNRQRTGKGTSAKARRAPPSPTPAPVIQVSGEILQGRATGAASYGQQDHQAQLWNLNQFLPRGGGGGGGGQSRVVSGGFPTQKNTLEAGKASITTFDGQRKTLTFPPRLSPRQRQPRSKRVVAVPGGPKRQPITIQPRAFKNDDDDDVETDLMAEHYWQDLQAQNERAAASKRERSSAGPKNNGDQSVAQQAEAASVLLRLASRC